MSQVSLPCKIPGRFLLRRDASRWGVLWVVRKVQPLPLFMRWALRSLCPADAHIQVEEVDWPLDKELPNWIHWPSFAEWSDRSRPIRYVSATFCYIHKIMWDQYGAVGDRRTSESQVTLGCRVCTSECFTLQYWPFHHIPVIGFSRWIWRSSALWRKQWMLRWTSGCWHMQLK